MANDDERRALCKWFGNSCLILKLKIMDERLLKLKEILGKEEVGWPQLYFFKFIVPNDKEKLETVRGFFSSPSNITYRTSKDIKYIGVSCKQWMPDPDSVVAIYDKAYKVEGVIAL